MGASVNGASVGPGEGNLVGEVDGVVEGAAVGVVEGTPVGEVVGVLEGAEEGALVGDRVASSLQQPLNHSAQIFATSPGLVVGATPEIHAASVYVEASVAHPSVVNPSGLHLPAHSIGTSLAKEGRNTVYLS